LPASPSPFASDASIAGMSAASGSSCSARVSASGVRPRASCLLPEIAARTGFHPTVTANSALTAIATMNHAHTTHYSLSPDPGIKNVLRGWSEDQKPARVDVQYKDVRVRNVPTNIRTYDGGTERHGNSIFIFEVANLCIAHLGHLHHTLTQQQLNEIGRVDVVLVPVDGSYTLDLDGMVEVLHAMKAPLMIPMHYFSAYTLDRFLQRVRQEWDVEVAEVPSLVVSKASLPAKPKVLVLPGH